MKKISEYVWELMVESWRPAVVASAGGHAVIHHHTSTVGQLVDRYQDWLVRHIGFVIDAVCVCLAIGAIMEILEWLLILKP
jgi:hypothetical protein